MLSSYVKAFSDRSEGLVQALSDKSEGLVQAIGSLQTSAVAATRSRPCSSCGVSISALESLVTSDRCRICCRIFCSKCLTKSSVPVPTSLLHESFRPRPADVAMLKDDRQLICNMECHQVAVMACMEKFRKEMSETFTPNFDRYLTHEFCHTYLFELPSVVEEDTAFRQALRFVQIAEVFASFGNFSKALKAMKYAYMGTTMINVMIAGDLFPVLSPLLEALKRFGITGPAAVLKLYYLGCKHTLHYKLQSVPRSLLYTADNPGILLSVCPLPVLDYLAQYISPAEWLYLARLPPPHQGNDWSGWYLSKMIARQEWTLLLCVNDTTKLANGAKCPAFAVMARCYYAKVEENGGPPVRRVVREAQVIVRGSASTMDWAINFEDTMCQFIYTYVDPEKAHLGEEAPLHAAKDIMHYGMYKAALGILDAYALRPLLQLLLMRGYNLKFVGHSLGAAVAATLAMEMRSSLLNPGGNAEARLDFASKYIGEHAKSTFAPQTGSEEVYATVPVVQQISAISAVIFSCPAFLGPALADAVYKDRLLVNVVNGSDPVPRFCYHTLSLLVNEMQSMAEQVNVYIEEDKDDLCTYIQRMGKAGDINLHTSDQRAARANRARQHRDRTAAARSITNGPSTSSSLFSLFSSSATPAPSSIPAIAAAPSAPSAPSAPLISTAPSSPPSQLDVPSAPEGVESVGANVGVDDYERLLSSSSHVPPAAAPAGTTAPGQSAPKEVYTVTPSPIVHMYKELNGTLRASVVTHEHSLFSRIELIPSKVMSEHDVKTYRCMLEGVRSIHNQGGFAKDEIARDWQRHFPQALQTRVQRTVLAEDNAYALTDILPLLRHQPAIISSPEPSSLPREPEVASPVEEASPASAAGPPQKPQKPQKPPKPARSDSASSFFSTMEAPSLSRAVSVDDDDYAWTPCSICGLEVTWPFIFHSDSGRAAATHNCGACGRVVCSVCAPAGDSLPGDGLNTKYQVEDLKLALPALGVVYPTRVCVHCYSDSSHPGLTPQYLQALHASGP